MGFWTHRGFEIEDEMVAETYFFKMLQFSSILE